MTIGVLGKNRRTCTKYYNIQGQLTDRRSGYAYCRTEWNDRESCYMQTWYDIAEKPMDRGGYVTLVSYTSPFGRVTANSYLDENGEPTDNASGIFTVEYDYDEQGRIIGNRYLGENGEPAVSSEGYASFTDTLDENGFVTLRVCYGTDGSVIRTMKYNYDDSMNLTEITTE